MLPSPLCANESVRANSATDTNRSAGEGESARAIAVSSPGGRDTVATVLFAAIGGADYLDGFAARVTGQYSRLGALLDPIVDRLLIVSGLAVALDFALLPRWAIVLAVAREPRRAATAYKCVNSLVSGWTETGAEGEKIRRSVWCAK